MHVHFVGEPDNGISVSSHMARALGSLGITASFDTTDNAAHKEANPDLVHVVAGPQLDHTLIRRLLADRRAGRVIAQYFSPREYLWALHHPPTRRFAHTLGQLGALQWTGDQRLADDLERIGISAKVAVPPNPNISNTIEPSPLPGVFTVLTYLPSARREFHGGTIIDSLIPRLADMRFLILGDTTTDYSDAANVESLGRVDDVSRAIRRATVVVQMRLDQRFSRLVLESLCHGRHAITTAEIPGCLVAKNAEECFRALRQVQRDAAFHLDGREYACRDHNGQTAASVLRGMFEQALADSTLSRSLVGTWQVTRVLMRNPAYLAQKSYPPVNASELPPGAMGMRSLVTPPQPSEV